MNKGSKFSMFLIGFYVFAAVSTLVSLNIGIFWLNSALILISSIFIAFLLIRKTKIKFEIPNSVWALSLLMMLISAFPLLFLHPFYDASADPAQTIILRALKDKIPQTFEPYSNLSFSYQFGFQLFVKQFNDLLPILPDYFYNWLFGVIFMGLLPVLAYFLVKQITENTNAGLVSAAVLFGAKTIFRDSLLGSYGVILGLNFLILTIIMIHRNSKLKFLFFPVVFALHPGIAILLLIFLFIYFFFYKEKIKENLILPLSLFLVLPALFINYPVLGSGALNQLKISFENILSTAIAIPFWIGLFPMLLLLAAFLLFFKNMKKVKKEKLFFLITFALPVTLFALMRLAGLGMFYTSKFFELVNIGVAGFVGLVITEKKPKKLSIAVLVICIVFFGTITSSFFSGELIKYRMGSKITKEEYNFALEFYKMDSRLERVFIASKNSAKIAEYSNKIPFDPMQGWFLPYDEIQVRQDQGYKELIMKHEQTEKILTEKCTACLYKLDVKYVIINKKDFDWELKKELLIFSDKNFEVYKLR
ncbi:MAG: hypothetical protein AB1467_05655 [Candidatus Diapherotrites archaeon]